METNQSSLWSEVKGMLPVPCAPGHRLYHPDDPRPVLLIDLSSIFHPAWHVNENGPVSVAFEATIGGVKRCVGTMPPEALVAICCDGKGNWRKTLSPAYKAHREKLPQSFYGEFQRVKDRLKTDGYLLWEQEGFEADDLLGTACRLAKAAGHRVRIASGDKDLLQLVGPGVDYLSVRTFDVLGEGEVYAKMGVKPENMVDFLALCGDRSDGVAGVPGVGPKRAAELISKFGPVSLIYSALEREPGTVATPAVERALTEGKATVELGLKLVALALGVPIHFEDIYADRKPAELKASPEMESEITADSSPVQENPYPEAPPVPSVELVPVVEYTQALEPRNFRDTLTCAKILWNARLYQKYKGPEAMAAVIMRGRELGMGAATALDVFHVIEPQGTLAMHAHLIIDLVMRHPDCEYLECVETSDKLATYVGKSRRQKQEMRLTYTIEQADRAGLTKPTQGGKPSNWVKRPDEMLRKTCGVQLGRVIIPGAAIGLYAIEEMAE